MGLTRRAPAACHDGPGPGDAAHGFGNAHIPARRRGGRPGGSGQGSPAHPAALKGQDRRAQEGAVLSATWVAVGLLPCCLGE